MFSENEQRLFFLVASVVSDASAKIVWSFIFSGYTFVFYVDTKQF